MLVNQHFNFLFEPVTSHCSAYCYELFPNHMDLSHKALQNEFKYTERNF